MIQSILYSQVIYFTYIYLSEARTPAKYRKIYGKYSLHKIIDYWNNTFNRQRLRFRRKGIHVHC